MTSRCTRPRAGMGPPVGAPSRVVARGCARLPRRPATTGRSSGRLGRPAEPRWRPSERAPSNRPGTRPAIAPCKPSASKVTHATAIAASRALPHRPRTRDAPAPRQDHTHRNRNHFKPCRLEAGAGTGGAWATSSRAGDTRSESAQSNGWGHAAPNHWLGGLDRRERRRRARQRPCDTRRRGRSGGEDARWAKPSL